VTRLRQPLALGLVLAGLGGCGSELEQAGQVVARDARYRVTSDTSPAPTATAPGSLRVRVETLNGWHVAPEAPARLDLTATDALHFEPAELREQHLQRLGDDGFEFSASVRATRPGPATAHARLKFGICEGPKAKCVIVRRELELPLEVARVRP
jgi:hypothetical protein